MAEISKIIVEMTDDQAERERQRRGQMIATP
jgi:hypothetical protein